MQQQQQPPQMAPSSSASQLPHSNAGASGSGQDFVLFDDQPSTSAAPCQGTVPLPPPPSRPGFTDKPSFTEYRAAPGPGSTGAGSIGGQHDSPFSSPASRFEDDFPGPSSVGSYGSSGTGTLSPATGLPNRKRQRGNDGRGHASTASLGSLSSALNTTARHNRNRLGSAGSHHSIAGPGSSAGGSSGRGSLSGDGFDRSRIPGLTDAMADDWTLADGSPQNPPSGSFGPAIGSLSLGAGADNLLPSLFPQLQTGSGDSAATGNYYPSSSLNDSGRRSSDAHRMFNNTSSGSLFSDAGLPMQTDPTPAQEALARQQVQQDLAGVDQRALRGPLRALVQEAQQQQQPQGASSNMATPIGDRVSQAQMDSALRAAVESFMAETDAKGNMPGAARAPGSSQASMNAWNSGIPMNKASTVMGLGGMTQAQRSLLFPGASPAGLPQAVPLPPQGNQQLAMPSYRPSVGPRRRSNSFDVSFLPASRPWFSQSPPQPDRANVLPHPGITETQQGPPGGFGMGQGTGWIGLPTNSFNAFDLGGLSASQVISAAQQDQGKPLRRTLNRDRSGLTVKPQETFLQGASGQGGDSLLDYPLRGWQGGDLSGPMLGADSSGDSSFNGNALSAKPPLNRGDTAKPGLQQLLQQQQLLAQVPLTQPPPSQPPRPLTANSSASSAMSLFSPAGSETTPSTEDEDEKPFYAPPLPASQQPRAGSLDMQGFLKQQQQGNWPFASGSRSGNVNTQSGAYSHPPRFMASSSSSSESEDDTSPIGSNALRGFGPFYSSGVGLGPNPNALASVPQSNSSTIGEPQQLGRGRGLQGGYGYMPGSADSGLRLETSVANGQGGAAGFDLKDISGPSSSQFSQDGSMANGDSSRRGSGNGGGSSPSIRSTAQAVGPNVLPTGFLDSQQRNRGGASGNKAAYGGYPLPNANSNPTSRRSSNASSTSASLDEEDKNDDESPDAAAAESEEDEEDYLDDSGDGRRKKKSTTTASTSRRKATGSTTKKSRATTTRGGGSTTAPSGLPSSSGGPIPPTMYGHQLPTGPGGVSHSGNLTICEYISPFSGIRCGTEFHRPYDLARHRETIHAKEEASLMRQGKLKKEQCRVLYVEVDPETSAATKEWKCDSCGRTFSRRDALLRHERLRAH